ncbi:MAG: exo-alpha-sialidase [Cytophagales bacterium]|nr:exo-alpha-sialidase [Cytophagales bacterium]
MRRVCFITLALGVLGLGVWRHSGLEANTPDEKGFFLPAASQALPNMALREVARYDIPMLDGAPAAHASFLLADKSDGRDRLRVFWFAGSRESGPDVEIVMSEFANQAWTNPVVVVNRHTAFRELGLGGWIRRLGNPVAWTDTQGRTHLYVVATGLGGWSASRILHLVQQPPSTTAVRAGQSEVLPFKPQGFLQLSPFFNLSVLVRGAPVPTQDGGVLLPAYFEVGIKYPLAIRLDANGELVQSRDAVTRMAGNLASLQPSVVPISQSHAIAYLRDGSDKQRLRFVQTIDGGKSWSDVQDADAVINPDASAVALRVGKGDGATGRTLLIHNPQTSGRHRLVIDGSQDGLHHWKKLATLEYEPERLDGVRFNEYSYPSAVVIGSQLHVTYTYQKRFIRHRVVVLEAAP